MPLFSSPLLRPNPHPLFSATKITSSQQQEPKPVKVPTAPWMTSPLLLPPDQLLNLVQPTNKNRTPTQESKANKSLTERVKGGRSRQAMRKIIQSVSRLRGLEDDGDDREMPELEERVSVPWGRRADERMVFRRVNKERVETAAERELPGEVLERLRAEARRLRRWVKAKKAGVTGEVVDEIRRGWRREELVMVKIVEPLCWNMDRAMEIIEIKTGGLVVWRKKDTLVVYGGSNYQLTSQPFQCSALAVGGEPSTSTINFGTSDGSADGTIVQNYREVRHSQITSMDWALYDRGGSINESLYEREANRLLDGLGPRFIDWWWRKPLPVDADLIPEVVPDFKPPFRLCPPRERPKLTDDELTYLRKLARPLPTHFALGKNTKLQGLAAAIIKLWEKSLIAKIAIKVGVPNTNNQQMSVELKRLTGGVLILRNKFFIILYRGKDFLPGKVANSIHERETELRGQQLQEEEARVKAIKSFNAIDESVPRASNIGTISEFQDIQANHLSLNDGTCVDKIKIDAEKEKLVKELRDKERKLLILKQKIEKSEKELAKLNSSWSPLEQSADRELLTVEERQSFQRIGRKMDEFLLLGRRGIYDGTIESIHQHWKHREVVKIITKQQAFQQITYTARLLEIVCGGILVAVEKLRRGHAIIIYRGKNYDRMLKPLPENLLTKREALQRSIEIQRLGSMKYFAWQKQRTIWELTHRLRYLEQRAREQDRSLV